MIYQLFFNKITKINRYVKSIIFLLAINLLLINIYFLKYYKIYAFFKKYFLHIGFD